MILKKVVSIKHQSNACQDVNLNEVFFKNDELLHYGPYEEKLLQYLAAHPEVQTESDIPPEDRALLSIGKNNLRDHIQTLSHFVSAIRTKDICLYTPPLSLNYSYEATLSPQGENGEYLIVLPANIFREKIFRTMGSALDKYITRDTVIGRKQLCISERDWPKLHKELNKLSLGNNAVACKIMQLVDKQLRLLSITPSGQKVTIPLPPQIDHFSNQVAMLDILLNALLGFEQTFGTTIPCIMSVTGTEEKEILEAYISDFLPKKYQPVITFVQGQPQDIPQVSSRFVIECDVNNLLATYNLSSIRAALLLSTAFNDLLHGDTTTQKSTIGVTNTQSPLAPKSNILYSVYAIPHLFADAPCFIEEKKFALPTDSDWTNAGIVTTPQALRSVVRTFNTFYQKLFHQFDKHIAFTTPTQAKHFEVFLSNRFFRNEADYYRMIQGRIIPENDSRIIIDVDLFIEAGGELRTAKESSAELLREHPQDSATMLIGSATTATTVEGQSARTIFGDKSSLILDFPREQVMREDTDEGITLQSYTPAAENKTCYLKNMYIPPYKSYTNTISALSYDEAMVYLKKNNRPIFYIDDEERQHELFHHYIQTPNAKTNSISSTLVQEYRSVESLEQAYHEQAALDQPGIIIVDNDLGQGHKKGLESIADLRLMFPEAKIILFTASSMSKSQAFANAQDADEDIQFIEKPINIENIADAGWPLRFAILSAVEALLIRSSH